MAANSVQFTQTAHMAIAQVSTANTNRDGTGTIATVAPMVVGGRRINKVTVKAIATSTAGMVRFYWYDGTNTRLYFEVGVTAITASASVATFISTTLYYDSDAPIISNASWELRASTHNAETFNIFVEYGDY